ESELDRRALTDQHADDGVVLVLDGHVLRLQELRARLGALVLAGEVHPEEDAPHLSPGLALAKLVLADPFRVPDATARSQLQERSGFQPGALHGAAGTGAVARARGARDRVPEVVEPAVPVRRVQARPLRGDGHDGL